MLDTIKPKYRSNYAISDFSAFKNNPARLFDSTYYPNSYVETIKEFPPKKNPLHLQALTFAKVKYDPPMLLSEGSLPKQLFGNNLVELTDADFNNAALALKNTLQKQSIEIADTETIKNAELKRCDFSKNIIIPKNIPIKPILEELSKTKKTNHHLDIEKISFENGGSELRIACKSYDIVFYDKTKELEKQQNISLNCNIFRMEVRLKNERVLKSKLEKAGVIFDEDYKITLKDVFSEDVSKKVLTYFWNSVISNLPKTSDIDDILARIYQVENNANNKPLRKEFMLLGMNVLENILGSDRLNALLQQGFDKPSTLQDIRREYKEYTANVTIPIGDGIKAITEALSEFILITPNILKVLQKQQ
jgi:hypothetical protein